MNQSVFYPLLLAGLFQHSNPNVEKLCAELRANSFVVKGQEVDIIRSGDRYHEIAYGGVRDLGTAFPTTTQDVLQTAWHVLRRSASLQVCRGSNGPCVSVSEVSALPGSDFGLLKIPVALAASTVARESTIEVGSEIIVGGVSGDFGWMCGAGQVVSKLELRNEALFLGPGAPGCSGGPVVKRDGNSGWIPVGRVLGSVAGPGYSFMRMAWGRLTDEATPWIPSDRWRGEGPVIEDEGLAFQAFPDRPDLLPFRPPPNMGRWDAVVGMTDSSSPDVCLSLLTMERRPNLTCPPILPLEGLTTHARSCGSAVKLAISLPDDRCAAVLVETSGDKLVTGHIQIGQR